MIDFIENNIHFLTIEHIKKYANNQQIQYTEEEANIIYDTIMNHYKELIIGDITPLNKIKEKINPKLYQLLVNLYHTYQKKY